MTNSGTVVACCQIALQIGDQTGNRAKVHAAINRAADGGAQVIVLPELANTGYMFSSLQELRALAERVDGPTIAGWQQLAAQRKVIIVGGFAEKGHDGKIYNSAVIVDETGLRATYRKAHLWDREKLGLFTAGSDSPPVVDTTVGRIGLLVCYDLEFPEWVRHVADAGAVLLCAPVNWPLYPRPAGERPGEIVRAQAAASSNRIFVAIADRVDTERDQAWLGGSVIIDPDGYPTTTLCLDKEAVIYATLNLPDANDKSISAGNDVHKDRRPDLYT